MGHECREQRRLRRCGRPPRAAPRRPRRRGCAAPGTKSAMTASAPAAPRSTAVAYCAPRSRRRPGRPAARAPARPRRPRVRARDRLPAAVGDDRDPVAGRERLGGEQRGHVELLEHGVGADDARALEQRVDGHVGRADQRAGAGRARAPPPLPGGRSRPPRSASRAAIRRATAPNRRGLPNDSRYSSTTQVASSSSQYCRKSLPERSALSPVDTNEDRPTPRRAASAIAATPSAPLCEASATGPAAGATGGAGRVHAQRRVRVEDAHRARADQPHAAAAASGRAATRAGRGPSSPPVQEAAGEHHQRADAPPPRTRAPAPARRPRGRRGSRGRRPAAWPRRCWR